MRTPAQATSVRHEIAVAAPIDRAFKVFTEDFRSFKPREHNLLSVDIAETVFEAADWPVGQCIGCRVSGVMPGDALPVPSGRGVLARCARTRSGAVGRNGGARRIRRG